MQRPRPQLALALLLTVTASLLSPVSTLGQTTKPASSDATPAAALDSDGDGVTDELEQLVNTNPFSATEVPARTVISASLSFIGDEVETVPGGTTIRELAIYHGRSFAWQGQVSHWGDPLAPEAVSPEDTIDLTQMSEAELAESLRGTALYQGHQFVETEPAYDLARQVKRYQRLQQRLEQPGPNRGKFEALLERLLPGQAPAPGSAPTAMDEAFEIDLTAGDRGAIEPRQVHSTDDRFVQNNLSYPYRTQIVFDNTSTGSGINGAEGSGTLIGSSTAMSVAHVFWDETNDTWEPTHRWAPGYDSEDADRSPWGEWYGCYWVTIPTAYTTSESATWDFAVLDFNVGCNSVSNGVNSDQPGSTVGWLGNYTASESAIESATGYVRGYPGLGTCGNPGQPCNVRIWGDYSWPSENEVVDTTIRHQADTSGGQSGSAFYHYADPTCTGCGYGAYLVGMHRAGNSSYNLARLYDATVRSFMLAYSDDH